MLSIELTIGTETYSIVPALVSVHLGQMKVTGFDESHFFPPDCGVPSYLANGYTSPVLYV